jgi:hypothetical protein
MQKVTRIKEEKYRDKFKEAKRNLEFMIVETEDTIRKMRKMRELSPE